MATTKPYEPKVGHKVNVNSRHGKTYSGKVNEIHEGKTGNYYAVNIGDHRTPVMRRFRATELSRA